MYRIIYILLLVSCLFSCSKPAPQNTPTAIFNLMWTQVDQGYSFFTYKNINWDSIREVYRPQISDDMGNEALFDVLATMLFELRDGHVNLRSSFNLSRNWEWYLDAPQNFDYNLLERNYFNQQERFTGSLLNLKMGNVGYIRYSSFSNFISTSQLDYLIEDFKDLDGIIIDVRDNGGGSINNIQRLVSRFADERRHCFSERLKNGPNHNDFTEKNDVYIEPEGPQQFTKPVIVLTNRSCYSATSFFIAAMKAFPHVTIVGDTTGGGGGIPIGAELPNGWTYRYSASETTLPNGTNIELGVAPDVSVNMTAIDEAQGKDSILEYALSQF